MRAVHGAVVQVQKVRAAKFGQQRGVQARPDAGFRPVSQPAPSRDSGAAHGLRGDIAPCDTGPQHVDDAGQGRPVRDSQSPGVAVAPLRSGRQHRGHPLPQVIRYEINTHPDTLPTKIAKCKVHCSLTWVDVKFVSRRASSGLGGETLTGEVAEAAAGDVDGCLVSGHAEEFV